MRPFAAFAIAFVAALSACRPAADPADAPRNAASNQTPPWEWTEDEVRSRVDQVRAGRDLTPAQWPDGNRVAVLLSFDVDNETVYGLRDGQSSVGPMSEGQYGARRGLPRVLDLLERTEVPATFFFPAWSLKLAPEQAEMIQSAGMHEIAVHGWIHERNTELDEATERELLERAVASLLEITGERPRGYRAPSWNFSPNTLQIVRDMGFLYESSLMADDRPYELVAEGEPTGLVELPVSWVLDDAPLLNPQGTRYSPPRDLMQVWIDEFDKAWEEGTMFLLTMHPHRIGPRSRIVALEGLIEHMRSRDGVWFATHEDAAMYVREQAGM